MSKFRFLARRSRANEDYLPSSQAEFLKSIGSIIGLDQLLESLSSRLSEMFHSATFCLVLYEPITSRYVGRVAKGRNHESLQEICFSRSDSLVKWLSVNKCPLNVVSQSEVVRFLSLSERELLARSQTQIVIPLIVTNRLTGCLLFGGRDDKSNYSLRDIELMSNLASHVALAIENAALYQFQQDKLEKLFHADKLATVGELAAGAAHEIRNPLTSIRSTIQFIQKDVVPQHKALIDGIIEEVDRIDRIIRGLLSLSRSTELQVGLVDLKGLLDQTLLLLEPEFRKQNITLQKSDEDDILPIEGDPSQLKQVILNILMNSIESMHGGGVISVRLVEDTLRDGSIAPSNAVILEVRDTGPGIPEGDLRKVFDPFFTTKETGTGLGLSVSYGIVNRHGGDIEIHSHVGDPSGTTVTVRLPRKSPYSQVTSNDTR